MKDLNYYMSLPYRIEIFPDNDGYTARIPDLPGCITCADTWEELKIMVNDAKKSWLATSLQCGDKIPEPAEPYRGKPVVVRVDVKTHEKELTA